MLQQLRENVGMTQAELAEHLGVGRGFVGHMELGRAHITPDRLEALRTLFSLDECSFMDLYCWAAESSRALREARREAA